jgi:hypothetical protein
LVRNRQVFVDKNLPALSNQSEQAKMIECPQGRTAGVSRRIHQNQVGMSAFLAADAPLTTGLDKDKVPRVFARVLGESELVSVQGGTTLGADKRL